MAAKGIKVDASFDCRIRATGTIITAQQTDPPQPVPKTAMPGRRLLRIMNNGRIENDQRVDVQVMIGNRDVGFPPQDEQGFGLELDEFIELPIDDSIIVYAIVNGATPEVTADLRTIELR